MTSAEKTLLQLSGIQHYSFCPRQWALIHVEKQWAENLRTVEGNIMHSRAHDASQRERRENTLILRGISICSNELGFSGQCDVVEFHMSPDGVKLRGESGKWLPFPVEYKRGEPKENNADKLQLCAQAMCLEEMLCCKIFEGALFYGETRRRLPVEFTEELRAEVGRLSEEMHALAVRGYTPKAKMTKGCNACSLKELCLPKLVKRKKASSYIDEHIKEEDST